MIKNNVDELVVADFGREWARFDQSKLSDEELNRIFNDYFSIFPWKQLPENAKGFDLGCGSGRWAKLASRFAGELHCIDPSSALEVAKRNLADTKNCLFHQADVDNIPLADNSMDFGYSLGVLHHVPDTAKGITNCVAKLKPNAPFLVYLYYGFDNKPSWFKIIWKISDFIRQIISRLPSPLKLLACQVIAAFVYFPMARLSRLFEKIGFNIKNIPLSIYRDKSFYTMQTDALDRFGTRLEQRFTRFQIEEMMKEAGLSNITFSEKVPYWCAVGYKFR